MSIALGFMEAFSAQYTSNSSDNEGRYAYANQPQMGLWNVTRLAEALCLLPEVCVHY
jgi:uncharacterized protein YdiU (UPF0061 family)